MRYLFIVLLAFTVLSCKEYEILRYEYHTTTQMGRTVLSVTQDSVIVAYNGRSEPTYWAREVKESEWNGIVQSMKDVDLSKVSNLASPSNKRATDAAPFAKFKFIGKDTITTSSDFDAKNPHILLQPLMDQFIKIEGENKK